MKAKSLAFSLLTFAASLLAIFSQGYASATVQSWAGAILLLITALLNSPILSTGTWPTGWGWSTWVTSIAGVVLLWLTQIGDSANPIISPAAITLVMALINAFLTGFVKQYTGDGGQSILGDTGKTPKNA